MGWVVLVVELIVEKKVVQIGKYFIIVWLFRDQYDRRIWCHHGSRDFSTKSFIDAITKLQVGELGVFSYVATIWCNVGPPKVELLV